MRARLLLLSLVTTPAVAQTPIYENSRGGTGIELRSFSFGQGIQLRRASQLSFPVFAGTPFRRRFFFDVTTNYAVTKLEAYDSATVSLSGPTDTQLRASYTAMRDVAVVSLALNVPSGVSKVATSQLAVIRSAAQNFLPFPVSNYGAGLGVTGGVVLAQRWGDWNLGLAGSLRYISAYSPFTDATGRYSPGVETRIRLGVTRLLGERTGVSGGFTFTTFGTDEFTGVPTFVYRSGNRYIGELALTRQVGRANIRLVGWIYQRAAGDSSGARVDRATERILHGGLLFERPISPRLGLDAALEARSWRPSAPSKGWLAGVRAGGRMHLSSVLTLAAAARLETGRIWLDLGEASIGGLGASVSLIAGN